MPMITPLLMQVEEYNPREGFVEILTPSAYRNILISGRVHMNRAVHGDIVCVELLPKSDWTVPSRIRRLSYPSPPTARGDVSAEMEGATSSEDDDSSSLNPSEAQTEVINTF
jgi:exoribonuclease R